MSSGRLSRVSAAAIVFATVWACGPDEEGAAPSTGDGGTNGDGVGGVDGADAPPPVRSEFGLDARPANPTCTAPARPPNTAPVKFERVYPNVTLGSPIVMAQAPGDGTRWFVAQRNGTLVTFPTANPGNTPTQVANLPALAGVGIVQAGEGGFLGMAIHPKFAQNGRIYVSWTTNGQASGTMRSTLGYITSPDGGKTFNAYQRILFFDQTTASNHKGGGLAFGKDGFLYAGFGDGGGGNDEFKKGQTKTGFFSKVLRLDVDNPAGGNPYGIPVGNPFKTAGGEPAVFAYGFRNPFRLSVDRETNELWVGDVGQNAWEEIDAKVKAGDNYGWPCREGKHDHLNGDVSKCPNPGATFSEPVVEHQHNPPRSITGGVVYRGKAMPAFAGTYVYGDYEKQELWSVAFDAASGEAKSARLNEAGPNGSWVAFGEDVDGEVYALALNQGAIYKLLPAGAQPPDNFPKLLSTTGCFDTTDPRKPASGLVPYGVNSALWSDTAKKERWIGLPENMTITVGANGDFDLPPGTVLVKSFSVGGKLVETRLFMRHSDGGWAGYTYEWNDAQTDAELLRSSKTKQAGTQTWFFPSRSECVTCHTEAAGRTLGLELGQQNGDFLYASTNRISNQLKTLEHIGMFGAPLGKPLDQILAYPDPTGTGGTVETRARSYLHSNCSNCHRPKGGGGGDIDVQWATPLKDTKTCNVDPQRGDIGIAGAKILAAGAPSKSLLSLRPHSPAANRMPPLASSLVDDQGVKTIDDWITSLTACPP